MILCVKSMRFGLVQFGGESESWCSGFLSYFNTWLMYNVSVESWCSADILGDQQQC